MSGKEEGTLYTAEDVNQRVYCNRTTSPCEHARTAHPPVPKCLREPDHEGPCAAWCSYCLLKLLCTWGPMLDTARAFAANEDRPVAEYEALAPLREILGVPEAGARGPKEPS